MEEAFNEVGICRLCATVKRTNSVIRENDNEICQKLEKCCQILIRMDDSLPKYVCEDCVAMLNKSYEFYTKVHDSQDMLGKCFSDSVSNSFLENTISETIPSLTSSEKELLNKQLTVTNKKWKTSDDAQQFCWTEYQCGCVWNSACKNHQTTQGSKEKMQQTSSCSRPQVESLDEIPAKENELIAKKKTEVDPQNKTDAPESTKSVENLNSKSLTSIIFDEVSSNTRLGLEKIEYVAKEDENVVLSEEISTKDASCFENKFEKCDMREEEIESDKNLNDIEPIDVPSKSTIEADEQCATCVLSEGDETESKAEVSETEVYSSEEVEEVEEEEEEENAIDSDELAIADECTSGKILCDGKTWESYPWKCMACFCVMRTAAQLIQHSKVHHAKSASDIIYFCEDCQKVFVRYYSFLNHVRHHHRPHLALCCDVCSSQLNDFAQLAMHRLNHNKNKNNKFPIVWHCDVCGKCFGNSNSLQIHKKTHLPDELKYKVSCKRCGQKFRNSTSLKMHMKLHLDIKDLICEQCGKKFRQKTNLEAHLFTHTTEKPYQCQICEKVFKKPENLLRHSLVHTEDKPFKCQYCDKEFRTKDSLKSHSRTHTGERPFKCKHCDRFFRFRSTLTTHENTHTGVRPYSCVECDHHFTNWANYNKHMKRRHASGATTSKAAMKTTETTSLARTNSSASKSDRTVIKSDKINKDKTVVILEKVEEFIDFDSYECLEEISSDNE